MASVTSFFNVGGNPFSTPVGQRIEQATDGTLASENWALNMEICDLINESSDSARDAMKAIKKRINQNAGKNYTVIMYTLTVLETCVKNCGKAFHLLVANKEFIQELVKLIGPKNDPPPVVQEKVLSLIQIWADAFRKQPDLNGVVQVYQELKNKGIEFPMTDMDAIAPIFTPQRSVPETKPPTQLAPVPLTPEHTLQTPNSPSISSNIPADLTPEQLGKLQSELDIVSLNMSIFGEMLTELKPGQEDTNDYKLMTELASTCKEMQSRIVELIGKINHDEITAELLRLNDEMNNLFLRHARYENNRDPKTTAAPSAILGAAMGIPTAQQNSDAAINSNKDSLIDLSDHHLGGISGVDVLPQQLANASLASSHLSQINSVSALSGPAISSIDKSYNDLDEFDMLAKSRKSSGGGAVGMDLEKEKLGAIGDTQRLDLISGSGVPNNTFAARNQPTRDTEFDEIAAWLETSHEQDDAPEESVTSKEFEKFLAERAAAAENLPTIPSQTGSTNTPKHKDKKEEEAGLLL